MRLHLIDGTYELFRAHFSQRPEHRGPGGEDRKAVVGLASALLSLLSDREEAVTHAAIAFDHPIRSFRNRLFDGYKTEEGVDPSLLAQFDAAEDAARAVGIPVWVMDEHEADDALATGAARFRDQVDQVRVLTPDKDLLQSVRGEQVVRVDRVRRKVATEATLRAERGFGPASVPDFLALVGDTSDGIPGLAGFGEKTAAKLLARYGSLESIREASGKWDAAVTGAPRLAATLEAEWEQALLYRHLATLVEDVPLRENLAALEHRGVPRVAFADFCDRVGANHLRNRPARWLD